MLVLPQLPQIKTAPKPTIPRCRSRGSGYSGPTTALRLSRLTLTQTTAAMSSRTWTLLSAPPPDPTM